jgi:hypothetical protein
MHFFDCVANIQRVGHEIKVAEGNVNKDLRGKPRNDLILNFNN